MIVWSLFIISHMGLFVYTQKGSIISMVDLPTTEIIEPNKPLQDLISQAGARERLPSPFYLLLSIILRKDVSYLVDVVGLL